MSEDRTLALALGLTHDPFAVPSDSFFAAGDRTRQLDELRQFSRGRRRMLAVTGDWGVGKSVMFRALSSRLDPGVKAARINASLVNDEVGMLSGIIQGFGLSGPERKKSDALVDVIVEHARTQNESNRYCLIMVDDAHALALGALETLLAMVNATPERGLRVVFFAEPQFVQSLQKAVQRTAVELSWHEIRLVPFSRDEVRSYLRYRFEEAGWDDHLPFTELQIQELIVDSRGYPGEIDRLASRLLSGNGGNASSGLFPPMHRAVLMLAGVVVGMVWLVWQFGELTQGPEGQSMVDRVARGNQRIDQAIVRAADPVLEAEAEAMEFEPATDVEPTLVDLATIDPEPVEPESVEPESMLDAESESALEPEPEPLAAVIEPESVPQPEAPVPEPEPVLEPEPTPVAPPEPAVPATTQAQSKPLSDSAVDPSERFDEPEEPEPTGPKLRAGANGAGWLMRQSPERYTLQLFGTSNLERMVAYVNRQEDISEFALLTLDRDGQPWYVVTYGLFSTPGAARDAAENLPSSTGRIDPWVRKIASVQAHIKVTGSDR